VPVRLADFKLNIVAFARSYAGAFVFESLSVSESLITVGSYPRVETV